MPVASSSSSSSDAAASESSDAASEDLEDSSDPEAPASLEWTASSEDDIIRPSDLEKTHASWQTFSGLKDFFSILGSPALYRITETTRFRRNPTKELLKRGFSMDDIDRVFRSRWQSDVVERRTKLGAQVLLLWVAGIAVSYLAPLVMLFQGDPCHSMDKYTRRHFGNTGRAVIEFIWILAAAKALLHVQRHPSTSWYSPIMVVFLGYTLFCYKLPPLGISCQKLQEGIAGCDHPVLSKLFGRTECKWDGFDVLLANMGTIWVTPFLFIRSQTLTYFLWGWAATFYLLTAVSASVLESESQLYEANVDLFVGALVICLMSGNAIATKAQIDQLEKKRFLADLEHIKIAKKMFRILQYSLPEFVIMDSLDKPGESFAVHVNRVSILFIVFANFDQVATNLAPQQLLQFLNGYFTQFDGICAAREVMKIETVSEEYVCAVGVDPADRAEDEKHGHRHLLGKLLSAACEILYLPKRNNAQEVVLQMGIHTGPIVGGVVGQKLPRYRLFGDTVNTAARMMQRGLAGEVQFGRATKDEMPGWAVEAVRPRGSVQMKGKGWVDVFLLDHSRIRRQQTEARTPSASVLNCSNTHDSPGGLYATLEDSLPLPPSLGVVGQCLDVGQTSNMSSLLVDDNKFEEFLQKISSANQSTLSAKEKDADFRQWFHENCFFRKLPQRMLRGMVALVVLTAVEVAYLFCNNWLMKGDFLGILTPYLYCRAACLVVATAWFIAEYTCQNMHRHPVAVEWLMMLSCYLLSLLLLASYETLPFMFENKTDTAKTDFPLTGLSSNVLFLMWAPLSMFLIRLHPTRLPVALCYFVLSLILLPLRMAIHELSKKAFGRNDVGHALEVITPWKFMQLMALPVLNAYVEEQTWRMRRESYRYVAATRQRVEGILDTLMPPPVVEYLRVNLNVRVMPSHRYQQATVCQSDISGFTQLASTRDPTEVVGIIGELFGLFDDLTEKFGVYKVETVGDAYIAARAEHPLTESPLPMAVVIFGLAMVDATAKWSMGRQEAVACRVGIHHGECVGGVVGIEMQRYHLFGDLMHVMELLEATSIPGYVQVSSALKAAVEREVRCQHPENADVDLEFTPRSGEELKSSKGDSYPFSAVGGATFFASVAQSSF